MHHVFSVTLPLGHFDQQRPLQGRSDSVLRCAINSAEINAECGKRYFGGFALNRSARKRLVSFRDLTWRSCPESPSGFASRKNHSGRLLTPWRCETSEIAPDANGASR